MFAPQTIPASPAVLMYSSLKPRILVFGFDSRGGLPIALSSYPSLPIFLRRCRLKQALVLGFMSPSSGWVSDHWYPTI